MIQIQARENFEKSLSGNNYLIIPGNPESWIFLGKLIAKDLNFMYFELGTISANSLAIASEEQKNKSSEIFNNNVKFTVQSISKLNAEPDQPREEPRQNLEKKSAEKQKKPTKQQKKGKSK